MAALDKGANDEAPWALEVAWAALLTKDDKSTIKEDTNTSNKTQHIGKTSGSWRRMQKFLLGPTTAGLS